MSAVRKEETLMTSQEMLDRSSSWTLACDNALLNRLKKFSEDLTKNSQDILHECDTLSRNVTQLDYQLINVSNEFLMLSNTQFVENRVEEFEEFSSSISSNTVTVISKTKAEREAALVSKMKQAIQLGYTACSERRERPDTSENRFKLKQPYLIGSPKFFSSKYCGLVDESRRQAPVYEDPIDMDSVSIGQSNDLYIPPTQTKPEVKFTMPPTPVFPIKTPGASDNHSVENEESGNYSRPIFPPSPTISERSSNITGGSVSSVPRDNNVPRSITDDLNKIYGSFAPPPAADDDSDDDFRPSAGVGRIFEDDDDIFAEKEPFPPKQKTDFFGKSNNSHQHPVPVFSVPPPINPVPVQQSKTTVNDIEALVGERPKPNDNTPNMNRVTTGDIPKKEDLIRGPPPEAEGPFRPKLPPGAVSLFGNFAPPVFNNGTLQAAPTASKDASSFKTKPDTQISSHSSVEVGSGLAPTFNRDTVVGSSHIREDVNQKCVTSQPSRNVTAPGRTENISQGSMSGCGDVGSKPKTTPVVPVSSLFADDSSDEDIFMSSKKHDFNRPKTVAPSTNNLPVVPVTKSTVSKTSAAAATTSSKKVQSSGVKKSIFDDSESEDDLFSSRPSFSRIDNNTKTSTNNDSLFKHDTKKATVPVKVRKKKSLFSDDSDSDTDLFGNKKKVEVKSSLLGPSKKVAPKMEEVNADEKSIWDDDDLFKAPVQKSVEGTGKSGVNNNNNENTVEEIISNEKPVIQSSSSDAFPIISKSIEIDTNNTILQEPKEKERAIKKSIFDDSESDDDLFSSKSSSGPVTKKSDSAPAIVDQKRPALASKVDKAKRSSLFGDDSDSDSDLFGGKSKKNTTEKIENSTTSDVEKEDLFSSKINEKDDTSEQKTSQQNSDELDTATAQPLERKEESLDPCDDNKQEDEPKSTKAIGSKISAKIKAMQTIKTDSSKTDASDSKTKKDIKPKVSVKSLALNLNINPLALKVGAKPPKPPGSTPGTPEKEANNSPPMNDPPLTIAPTLSSPDKPVPEGISKSNSLDNGGENDETVANDVDDKRPDLNNESKGKAVGVDDLVGILKARVKIQKKRRPPSRNLLKSLALREEKEEDNPKEEDNQKEVENQVEVPSEQVAKDDKGKEEEAESNHVKVENHDSELTEFEW